MEKRTTTNWLKGLEVQVLKELVKIIGLKDEQGTNIGKLTLKDCPINLKVDIWLTLDCFFVPKWIKFYCHYNVPQYLSLSPGFIKLN